MKNNHQGPGLRSLLFVHACRLLVFILRIFKAVIIPDPYNHISYTYIHCMQVGFFKQINKSAYLCIYTRVYGFGIHLKLNSSPDPSRIKFVLHSSWYSLKQLIELLKHVCLNMFSTCHGTA